MKKIIFFFVLLNLMLPIFGINNCLIFDGTNDFVLTKNLYSFLNGTSRTIELWFYAEEDGVILSELGQLSNNTEWHDSQIEVHANNVYVGYWGSSGYTHINVGNIAYNSWNHVVLIYDASTSKLEGYLNGVKSEFSSTNTIQMPNTGQLYYAFGSTDDTNMGSGSWFNGKIDEVRIWKAVRSETQIRHNMYRELPDPSSEEHLVTYYKFNEESGLIVADSKGSNDGDLTNYSGQSDYWITSPAMFGPKNCLDFDETDYVSFTNSPPYSETITIEAWIKTTDTNEVNDIVCWGNSSGMDNVQFRTTNGKLSFGTHPRDGYWISCQSSVDVNTGEWTHVAVVKDQDSVQLYVNGVADGSGSNPNTMNIDYMLIGKYVNDPAFFRGSMDEIRIWNTAREATEIRESMCKTLSGNENGLVAYYNFDNETGTMLQDFSGNGKDGTLINMDDSDWGLSAAFNTWLNTNNTTWSIATNWSKGVPSSTDNVGIYNLGVEPNISGTPIFNNLYLGSGISTTLNSNMTVMGSLILDTDLSIEGVNITLGTTGNLVENLGKITGTSGSISAIRSLYHPVSKNVAGLGAFITEDSDLGSTTIIRSHNVEGTQGIQRSYQISPSNSPSNATLVFNYLDSELNGVTEANLSLYKSVDGEKWIEQNSSVLDANNNTLTLSGINSFSWWTAAESGSGETLPVYLSSFTVFQTAENCAQINWQTQSEASLIGYNIYKSCSDNENDKLRINNLILNATNTSTEQNYQFIDEDISVNQEYFYWLESLEANVNSQFFGPIKFVITSDYPEGGDIPEIQISQGLKTIFPNPFNPSTSVSYYLESENDVTLEIFNLLGQKQRTIKKSHSSKGNYSIVWNGINSQNETVASGVYLFRLKIGEKVYSSKALLVK